MFGLKERHHPGRVLICFWCDSENKNFNLLRFRILVDLFRFAHFGYHQNLEM